mgnify:CR=1 FL=1
MKFNQHTVSGEAVVSGIGLHTGVESNICLLYTSDAADE